MYIATLTLLAFAASSASAKRCRNATVPVTISARQAVFDIAIPQTNTEVTDFVLNMTRQGGNFTDIALTGYDTTTGTYSISTQFCTPDNVNGTNPTLQFLTHGIGFDKTYWDLSFNDYNYSYVNTATDEFGYCTLSVDRLGIGNSSHGEPLNEIQAFLETAATAELTRMLRNGTFPGINQKFNKIVHVGHSFGSAQTYSLANIYPDLTDGIVLTGFSMNSSFVGYFAAGANFQLASENQPLRFSNITGTQIQDTIEMFAEPLAGPTYGYLISSNAEANKYLFLKSQYYDPEILLLTEQTKQPVTLGELLSLGSVPMMNNFAGPVMVITGDSDLPYCGGDCLATGGAASFIPAQVAMNFPNVNEQNFTATVVPNTGHGINLHYNATASYREINQFLSSKGLAPS